MSDAELFKAIKEYEIMQGELKECSYSSYTELLEKALMEKQRQTTYTELLQRIEGLEHSVMLLEKLYNNVSKQLELLKGRAY